MSEPDPTPPPPEKPPLPLEYRQPVRGTGKSAWQLLANVVLILFGVMAVLVLVVLGTCALIMR
jgi:hypothetical protein